MSTPLHGSEKNEHHACTELLIGATSASLVRIRVYRGCLAGTAKGNDRGS
uniref:Uncharacterized protein n=1 Tax=Setaria viridis TaxID=4556 RepID=A0A4V6D6X5_SETVI|nr:hypothetical protein SEVIR_5G276400v2 [Setaria viridis]